MESEAKNGHTEGQGDSSKDGIVIEIRKDRVVKRLIGGKCVKITVEEHRGNSHRKMFVRIVELPLDGSDAASET